ncbi:hypothetical protein [uncultured Mucilaginibacter sp.]|uniref:TRAFAC clade GTPase domain-containing protein n=1 Tax=uncultured Mucilaginibacter sp. TaxID=797541 RepID=UPI0025DA7F45|nr:hypothetical protein [uncultured Mucilaginibacter sp.]
MAEEYVKICTQPGCSFVKNNICMEGHLSDCDNLTDVLKSSIENSLEFEDITTVQETISLDPNVEYTEEQISVITYKNPANLVLLMGDPECGKSTLYASLFDRFQKGGCGNYYFAGTKTSVGFEKRCHHARIISQNKQSNTERTNTKDFVYLHLAVRHKSLTTPINHLLFADANGERFQAARNSDEEMLGLKVIKTSTHVCYIADGDTLLNKGTRHSVKNDAINLISRAVQNKMLDQNKGITLIIAKWDKVFAAGAQDSIESFFITAIKEKFPGLIKNVILIASRSQNDTITAGTGLDKFLDLILSRNPNHEFVDPQFALKEDSRSFQKFKYEIR